MAGIGQALENCCRNFLCLTTLARPGVLAGCPRSLSIPAESGKNKSAEASLHPRYFCAPGRIGPLLLTRFAHKHAGRASPALRHGSGVRFLTHSTKVLCSGSTKIASLFLCSRQESNLHYKLRKLASYPLNDGSNFATIQEKRGFSTARAPHARGVGVTQALPFPLRASTRAKAHAPIRREFQTGPETPAGA